MLWSITFCLPKVPNTVLHPSNIIAILLDQVSKSDTKATQNSCKISLKILTFFALLWKVLLCRVCRQPVIELRSHNILVFTKVQFMNFWFPAPLELSCIIESLRQTVIFSLQKKSPKFAKLACLKWKLPTCYM